MRGSECLYPIIDKEKTGRRIKELMEERNISVKAVQEYLSLESVQSVYYWIKGRSLPTIDNLYALSELLEVPIDAMISGSRTIGFAKTTNKPFTRVLFYYEKGRKVFVA